MGIMHNIQCIITEPVWRIATGRDSGVHLKSLGISTNFALDLISHDWTFLVWHRQFVAVGDSEGFLHYTNSPLFIS